MSASSRRLRILRLLRGALDRRATLAHRSHPIKILIHPKSSGYLLLVESPT
jgi:hypothetical protein